jgi:hypothetical protein
MIVKNFTKLVLLFSVCFIIIFIVSTSFKFLALHITWIKTLPPQPESSLTLVIAAAQWALSFALFSSILFSLSYSSRRGFNSLMAVISIMVFSIFFCTGISILLNSWEAVPPEKTAAVRLGSNGLILSNSLNRNETAVILLKGNIESRGPRVTSLPDQPLIFQESAGGNFYLPAIPFGDDTPWFLKSLTLDIRLNAEIFQKRFNESFFSFLIYAGCLIFLLCSLGYAIKFSAWPLVNLFLGILVFRGILSLETFLNTPEMLEIISSFTKNMIPVSISVPLIFLILGTLIHLYSFLIFVTRRQADDGH